MRWLKRAWRVMRWLERVICILLLAGVAACDIRTAPSCWKYLDNEWVSVTNLAGDTVRVSVFTDSVNVCGTPE